MLTPSSSFYSAHQSSFDDASIELAELGQTVYQTQVTAPDSLRLRPIATHLHLIDAVPELPNTAFMTQLMHQLNSNATTNGISVKSRWMQFIVRHRNALINTSSGVNAVSLAGTIISIAFLVKTYINMQGASHEESQALAAEQQLFAYMCYAASSASLVSLGLKKLLEYTTLDAVDNHGLNNHPQNVHAASPSRTYVAAFQALQDAIAHPTNKALAKEHILQVFDYLCEENTEFKKEMMALNRKRYGSDANKLQAVKGKIETAIDFMLGDAQADRIPISYPSTVTTSAVLTYVWSCVEHLSVAGYEDQSRLLTENLMKALYASQGLCNTGHVSRVLQAFSDTVRFGFGGNTSDHEMLVITPQDFYTLNQNELNSLLSDILDTYSIRAQLHELEQEHGEDRRTYKAAATSVVKKAFIVELNRYLTACHSRLLQQNPQFQSNLIRFLEDDFAVFIDNARNDDDMNSIASFS